jgi:transposase
MSTNRRRSYTEAFKDESVWRVLESGHPVVQVAWDLGIADYLLYGSRAEQQ